MVHRRELAGEELVLGNQGALYQGAMTWWDHGTGSVWSQPLGEAIMGPLAGARLELMSSTLTSWEAWRDAHPDTLALEARGTTSGFSLERMAIVVDLDDEAKAYPVSALQEAGGVVNDTVAGVELAVVIDPASGQRWSVLPRQLDGRVLTFQVVEGTLVDVETGTRWDPVRGVGLDGPLAGEALGLLPGFTSFVRDFERFWPEGEVWSS